MTGQSPDRAGVTGEHLRKASAARFSERSFYVGCSNSNSKLVPSSFMPGVACVLGAGFPARTGVGERSSSSIPGRWWGPRVRTRRVEASGPQGAGPCTVWHTDRVQGGSTGGSMQYPVSRPGPGSVSHTSARTGPDAVIPAAPVWC